MNDKDKVYQRMLYLKKETELLIRENIIIINGNKPYLIILVFILHLLKIIDSLLFHFSNENLERITFLLIPFPPTLG